MGTSKWSWIQQCHSRNWFSSQLPLSSSNLLHVAAGICWANTCPLALCSGWLLALDYQHEIRCWPAAHLPLWRHSVSNPYWVTWGVGLMPEVSCHAFSWEVLGRFPSQKQKALCPIQTSSGRGGEPLGWAVVGESATLPSPITLTTDHIGCQSAAEFDTCSLASSRCISGLPKLVRWWCCQSVYMKHTRHFCALHLHVWKEAMLHSERRHCPKGLWPHFVFVIIILWDSTFFFLYQYSIEHRTYPGWRLVCLCAISEIVNKEEKHVIFFRGKHNNLLWFFFFLICLYTLLEILQNPSQRNCTNCCKCKPDTVNLRHL